jgi:hypothetical protein
MVSTMTMMDWSTQQIQILMVMLIAPQMMTMEMDWWTRMSMDGIPTAMGWMTAGR